MPPPRTVSAESLFTSSPTRLVSKKPSSWLSRLEYVSRRSLAVMRSPDAQGRRPRAQGHVHGVRSALAQCHSGGGRARTHEVEEVGTCKVGGAAEREQRREAGGHAPQRHVCNVGGVRGPERPLLGRGGGVRAHHVCALRCRLRSPYQRERPALCQTKAPAPSGRRPACGSQAGTAGGGGRHRWRRCGGPTASSPLSSPALRRKLSNLKPAVSILASRAAPTARVRPIQGRGACPVSVDPHNSMPQLAGLHGA